MTSNNPSATTHLRSGDREQQHSASAGVPTMLDVSSFAAHGLPCLWLIRVNISLSLWNDAVLCPSVVTLQGGMLNHYLDVGVGLDRLQQQSCPASGITPLEECASNILIGDCVNIENIRTLLGHPEAPWTSNGDGFQITLGAAKLSLTKASNSFPNFTRVMNAYMQQCNNQAQGLTIVINRNLKAKMHIDSRNEASCLPHGHN